MEPNLGSRKLSCQRNEALYTTTYGSSRGEGGSSREIPTTSNRESDLFKERLSERAARDKEPGFGDPGSLFQPWLLKTRKQC